MNLLAFETSSPVGSVALATPAGVAVRYVDPRPAWRYRFGLSTNFEDRIACSHGGRLVEVELARAWRTRLWPRDIGVRRFWLGVREHEEFVAALERSAGSPHEAGFPRAA